MILLDPAGHLVSDRSLIELHEFAKRLGLRREWFQRSVHGDREGIPHYDLTTDRAKQRA